MVATAERVPVIRLGPPGAPARTIGWDVLEWTACYLQQPDGPRYRQPWTYTNEQARFVLNWYAVDEDGRWLYRYAMLRRMKGWGKDPLGATLCAVEFIGPCRFGGWANGEPVAIDNPAAWVQTAAVSKEQTRNTMTLFPGLFTQKAIEEYQLDIGKEIIYADRGRRRIEAVTSSPRALEGGRATFVLKNEAMALDTPIPTPGGWTTIGDLSEGDIIFGRDGQQTRVEQAFPVQYGRDCYRVTFADGTSVVVSDGHLWLTKLAGSAALPRVRTTVEMYSDARRFMVPRAGARQTQNVELPVDPYLLGVWLGDGSTGACNIAVGGDDIAAMQAELAKRGVETHVLRRTRATAARIGFSNRRGFGMAMGTDVAKALRTLPCYRDKHIPAEYLNAGTQQRIELLRGLLDTDGCVSRDQSQVIFIGRERLAKDVVELLRGLGQVPGQAFVRDVRSRDGGYWRVTFTPRGIQPFALARKADLIKPGTRDWLSIVSIDAVPSVPVRCIKVDAADSLFQAGKGGHVTHNTHHWIRSNEGHEMSAVIARNVAKSRDGAARVMAISNAHAPGEDSDAERDYDAYRKGARDMLYDSVEAPDDVRLSDPDERLLAVLDAVRGDSYWLSPERLLAEIRDPRTPPAMAYRYYLNKIHALEDKPFDAEKFRRLQHDYRPPDGSLITLGFDGSLTRDHTALWGTEVETGHQFRVGYWEPVQMGDEVRIDFDEVDQAVEEAFARWHVWRMYADPYKWGAYLSRWAGRYGEDKIVSWPTTNYRKMAQACAEYRTEIESGELSHDGDPALEAAVRDAVKHVLNVRDDDGERMWVPQKERPDSPLKIDALMAAILSKQAQRDAVRAGATVPARGGISIYVPGDDE